MKKSTLSATASIVFLLLFVSANAALAAAFPGAMGFGSGTIGGRGGKVIAVTNLNDSGPGSFRAAIEATGPRIIIFLTGGTIQTAKDIVIRNPYVTIAGQTAPGGGICLRGAGVYIVTHDVIMRGIRIRVGDDPNGHDPENRDGLNMDATIAPTYNVIVDHCSISWAIDENASLWGPTLRDVTVSNCIISEALNNSLHPKGPHSKGPQVGPGVTGATLYGNLMAHNVERNPRIQGVKVEFVNNVGYNRGKWDVDIGGAAYAHQVVIIGNYFKKGPSYQTNPFPIYLRPETYAGTRVFCSDNIGAGYTSGDLCNTTNFLVNSRPFASSGVTIRSPQAAYDWVLANAGANPKNPDPVDARIIREVKSGTGRIIDSPSQVGGWPVLAKGTPPVDSDGDGMPDSWEASRGLNPSSAADANSDRDNDGYTNIEEYINSFYETGSGSTTGLSAPRLRILSQN